MSKLTLTEKPGWLNRHLDGLPNIQCKIIVLGITEFINKEVVCIWNPAKYEKDENYLGYAEEYKFTLNKFKKLGFPAFKHIDNYFVYYKLYEETWLEKLIDRFIKLFKYGIDGIIKLRKTWDYGMKETIPDYTEIEVKKTNSWINYRQKQIEILTSILDSKK